jgi:5-oxoprolinase (ATP-hydrolysing)
VCYRKGGYLAVTDANVVLGRVRPEHFPHIFGPSEKEPLDADAARAAMAEVAREVGADVTVEEAALGFVRVANEAMCRPIRALTQMRGFDLAAHCLACFGGAGGQHACAVARALGMRSVFISCFAGVLSAYGLGLADEVEERQRPARFVLLAAHTEHDTEHGAQLHDAEREVAGRLRELANEAAAAVLDRGFERHEVGLECFVALRFAGTDTSLMVPVPWGVVEAALAEADDGAEADAEDEDVERVRGGVRSPHEVPLEAFEAAGDEAGLAAAGVFRRAR